MAAYWNKCRKGVAMVALAAVMLCLLPTDPVCAQATTAGVNIQCTQDVKGYKKAEVFKMAEQQINMTPLDSGFVSGVARQISLTLSGIAKDMFSSVARGIYPAVQAMISLYILLYGLLFMFGAVPITVWDFLVRAIKIVIVVSMLGASPKIYTVMYQVFECGTDDVINKVISMMDPSGGGGGGGGGSGCTDSPPLRSVDLLAGKVFSASTIATLIAALSSGVYGPIMGLLLALSMWSILQAILQAMWVYLMSKVVRTLLFGVAPVFLACLLFQRTKSYFDGWVNQLVSCSLQPIFLFAFFTFFVSLMTTAITKIQETPVCLTPVEGVAYAAPINPQSWRFAVKADGEYQLYTGTWGAKGANIRDQSGKPIPPGKQPIFPIPVKVVFVFFVVAELAARFNSVVLSVAAGMVGGSVNFSQISSALTSGSPTFTQTVNGLAGRDVQDARAAQAGRTGPPTSAGVGVRQAAGGSVANRGTQDTPPPKDDGPRSASARHTERQRRAASTRRGGPGQ